MVQVPIAMSTEEQEVDMISLQGTSDSPEYKSCNEWQEFTQTYDADEAILNGIGNGEMSEILTSTSSGSM